MTIPYWGWPSEPSTESILSYSCNAQLAPEPGVPPPPERLPQTAQGKDPLLPALPNRLSPLLGMALGLGLWAGLRQGRCRRLRWGGAVAGMGLAGLSLALLLNASLRLQGQSQPKPARLGKVVASYGLDRNGNGRFDALVVEVQVQVQQPGAYTLIGHLNDSTPTPQTTGGYLASASTYTTLAAGSQVVRLEFDGQTIYTNGEDGSYSLDELWLSDQPFPEEVDLAQQAVDSQTPGYRTAAYSRDAFENGGARLSGRYGHTSLDANQDGYFDSLMVTTDLQVNTPGAYRVEAELADSQGQLVATAAWNGSGGPVSLSFQALLGDVTSYYLRHVQLYGAQGELIDSAEADTSSPGVYATGPLYNLGLGELPAAYASPRLLNVQAKAGASSVDFRGYDVIVNTAIAVEGDYRLEAWLEGSEGELFAWEVSEPVHLTPGLRDLTLSFKERQLKVLKAKGPYKLISLKVLFNSGYTVVDQIDVAYDPSVSAKQSSQNSRP